MRENENIINSIDTYFGTFEKLCNIRTDFFNEIINPELFTIDANTLKNRLLVSLLNNSNNAIYLQRYITQKYDDIKVLLKKQWHDRVDFCKPRSLGSLHANVQCVMNEGANDFINKIRKKSIERNNLMDWEKLQNEIKELDATTKWKEISIKKLTLFLRDKTTIEDFFTVLEIELDTNYNKIISLFSGSTLGNANADTHNDNYQFDTTKITTIYNFCVDTNVFSGVITEVDFINAVNNADFSAIYEKSTKGKCKYIIYILSFSVKNTNANTETWYQKAAHSIKTEPNKCSGINVPNDWKNQANSLK